MSEPPTEPAASSEYRIEELAHRSGATVRTIRAYQDRGLLPRPERRGRANVYGDKHLTRLQQIAALLERGYTLSSIKELLEAWDEGRDLGGVLGLVAEVEGPWTDEQAIRITRAELSERFGSSPDEAAISEAVELGILETVPGDPDAFLVPSPRELAVAAELHMAGVPLLAIADHVRELRVQVEHIASRFLDFTTEHVFQQYLGHPPTDAEAQEAAFLIRRFRPLAQQTIDAELARAMRSVATRYLHRHLGQFGPLPHLAGAAPATAHGHTPPQGKPPQEATPRPEMANFRTTPEERAQAGTPHAESVTRSAARTAPAPPEPPPIEHPALHDPGHPPRRPGLDGRRRSRLDDRGHPALNEQEGRWGHPTEGDREQVALPTATLHAVRELVGDANLATFIAAAAEREVWARRMDRLAIPDTSPRPGATPDRPGPRGTAG